MKKFFINRRYPQIKLMARLIKKPILKKMFLFVLIILSIFLILSIVIFFIPKDRFVFNNKTIWGVTFSSKHTKSLGLDFKKIYIQMFDDFSFKTIRIPVYWDEVEKQEGVFDFEETDWLMDTALKNNSDVVLVVGYKVPRWPECHKPAWVENNPNVIDIKVEKYIEKVVLRYKDHKALFAWQVENEPLFDFGECIKRNKGFLQKEVNFVRSLDPNRKIIVTDSGELGSWRKTTKQSNADILGFTTYRIVWNPLFGYFKWRLLTPDMYKKRAYFVNKKIEDIYSVELQLEPWHQKFIADVEYNEQMKHFTTQDIKDNLNYAKQLKLNRVYLWGVEWWYYVAQIHNDNSVIKTIKEFLKE